MRQNMMKAGVLTGPQQIEIRQVPVPEMAPGMMQIRVTACGVCGSDIHMWKAGKGWSTEPGNSFHMGHEFCGVVVDPGESPFQAAGASLSGPTCTVANATCAGQEKNIFAGT